jgi:hypothetical protein
MTVVKQEYAAHENGRKMKMEDVKIDEMLHALLEQIDYDTAKSYRVETAEEPDYVEGEMELLRQIVRQFVLARPPQTQA